MSWENYCVDDEFVLAMELFNIGRDSHPGFTISYKKSKQPSLLRLSSFPDKDGLRRFGKSQHWSSPTLPDRPIHITSSDPEVFPFKGDNFGSSMQLPLTTSNLPNILANPSEPLSRTPELTQTDSADDDAGEPSIDTPRITEPEESAMPELGQPNRSRTEHSCKGRLMLALGINLKKIGTKAQEFAQSHLQWLANFPEAPLKSKTKSVVMHDEMPSTTPEDASIFDVTPTSQATYSPIASRSAESSTSAPSLDFPLISPALAAFIVTAAILILLSLGGFALFLFHRNPRWRAERAARREERRNRRLFRRAARKQKWRNFIRRVTGRGPPNPVGITPCAEPMSGPPSPGIDWAEWTEKHGAAVPRGPPPLDDVRAELRAFRSAHRHVDGILSAEEGHFSAGETSGGEGASGSASGPEVEKRPRADVAGRRRESNRRAQRWHRAHRRERRASEANSEKTAPPPYEEFEVTVADGIQYVRPVVLDAVTPDSSVVATSTRASAVDSDEEADKP